MAATKKNDINTYIPQEVAYRKPGEGWKRSQPKTKQAYTRLIAKLTEQGAEIRVRDAR